MIAGGLFMVQNKPLVHVIVIAVIALVAYFGWWKRWCDTVSGSNSIHLDYRRQFPQGITDTITGIVKTIPIDIVRIRVCCKRSVVSGICDSIVVFEPVQESPASRLLLSDDPAGIETMNRQKYPDGRGGRRMALGRKEGKGERKTCSIKLRISERTIRFIDEMLSVVFFLVLKFLPGKAQHVMTPR